MPHRLTHDRRLLEAAAEVGLIQSLYDLVQSAPLTAHPAPPRFACAEEYGAEPDDQPVAN
jgi:hypothetical protein